MEAINIGLKKFKKGRSNSVLNMVDTMGARLEQICRAGVSLEQAFEELERTSVGLQEIVVVEVMRESYRESLENQNTLDEKGRLSRLWAAAN